MVSQGFFSGSESAEKRRFAGEKENNANLNVSVKPVELASLNYPTRDLTKPYVPDEVGDYIKDTETKFPSTYTDSSGDIYTEKPYTETTPGIKFYRGTDAQLIRKKGDDPNFSQQYSTASGRENFLKERNAYLRDTGQFVPRDPNKDFEGKPLKTIAGPLGLIKSGLLFRKGFQDEGAKEYASFLDKNASYDYKMYRKDMRDKVFSESSYGEDVEKGTIDKPGYYYKDFQQPGVYRSEEDVKSYIKDRGAFLTDMPSNFEGGISGRGEKTDDLTSMYRSTAGDEKTRLEKAKEEQENRNILQRVGDFVGDTFNKLTGIESAAAGTLDVQGINTSATTNIAQMGGVSDSVQKARDAIAKSNLRKSGLDRTIGGASSQANYGRASRGFGTGTHGKGMPSNPKSMRQTGVGKSAGNLSRHKAGHSSSQPSSTPSTSSINRSQSRRRGSSGSSGKKGGSSSSGGGSSSSSSSSGTKGGAGRTASKASRSRTGRSRSQCDIRTKIDIAQLTNTDLFRDDLADVAYFVKEIK